jgi:hypothetical protein
VVVEAAAVAEAMLQAASAAASAVDKARHTVAGAVSADAVAQLAADAAATATAMVVAATAAAEGAAERAKGTAEAATEAAALAAADVAAEAVAVAEAMVIAAFAAATKAAVTAGHTAAEAVAAGAASMHHAVRLGLVGDNRPRSWEEGLAREIPIALATTAALPTIPRFRFGAAFDTTEAPVGWDVPLGQLQLVVGYPPSDHASTAERLLAGVSPNNGTYAEAQGHALLAIAGELARIAVAMEQTHPT